LCYITLSAVREAFVVSIIIGLAIACILDHPVEGIVPCFVGTALVSIIDIASDASWDIEVVDLWDAVAQSYFNSHQQAHSLSHKANS